MNVLKIRNVTLADLDGCYYVESTCFQPSEAASKERIEKRINIFPQGFLVAELGSNIVGHINSGSTNKEDISDEAFKDLTGHEHHGKNIVIFSLAVLPEFQKQGIAGKLLSKFIEDSGKMKKKKILLLCKPNLIRYYGRYGFIDNGKSASTHGGFTWHEMSLML